MFLEVAAFIAAYCGLAFPLIRWADKLGDKFQ